MSKAKKAGRGSPPGDEIDFTVAPPPPSSNNQYIYNKESLSLEGLGEVENINDLDDKEPGAKPFTQRELIFLVNHIEGGLSLNDAMDTAGYGSIGEKYKLSIARKLVKRYEVQAGDAAKVARSVGLGEVTVARKIKSLMEDGESEKTQLEAAKLASQWLRATEDPGAPRQGINIIIQTAPGTAAPAPGPPGTRVEVRQAGQAPKAVKPLMITK